MKDLQIFNYGSKEIRIIMKDGEPWWVARDVCEVLGIARARQAVENQIDDDEKLKHVLHASGQNRQVWIINEPGLYSLILRSNKPNAKKFKRWVTHEILPTIRKTGSYSVRDEKNKNINKTLKEKIDRLEIKIADIRKEISIYFDDKAILDSPRRNTRSKSNSSTIRIPLTCINFLKQKAKEKNCSIGDIANEIFENYFDEEKGFLN
jgi:prophage antirepressor-like protein